MSDDVDPPLRPASDIQKLLISSTSSFTDQMKVPGFLIAHATPGMRDRSAWMRTSEGPLSRNAFVVSFVARPSEDAPAFLIPTYEHVGELVCAYLTLFFGKRFDFHGALESSGYFGLPDLTAYSLLCQPHLPQNSHSPRADFPVPLVLSEVARLRPLLFGGEFEQRHFQTFRGAAKFHWRAILAVEEDPEAAFLHLVTAGEILANGHDFEVAELMDAKTRHAMNRIAEGLDDGPKIARHFESQLRRIKRRFISTIANLTDDAFFASGEAKRSFSRLSRVSYLKRLGAAYDLRSGFLHSGTAFGNWIAPRGFENDEVQSGKPIVDDKRFARALTDSPTYIGLERVIRYVLLRFGERSGLILSPAPIAL